MTDNARIVREALLPCPFCGDAPVNRGHGIECRTCGIWMGDGTTCHERGGLVENWNARSEPATAKADLARAREEERERIIGIITDPHNQITWRCPEGASVHADPRFIRAALAPEQKGE